MATDDDTTQPQPAAPAPGSMSGYLNDPTVQALLRQITNPSPPQLPAPPARVSSDGTRPGWLSLLGEGLGGGQSPLYHLSGSAEDAAGSRSLLNFGIGMLMASGPQRVRPGLGQIFGSGLQAAQESMDASQKAAFTQAGQQFQQQKDLASLGLEQQKSKIEQLNAILPLLRLNALQNQPSLYPPGNTPGPLSTSAPLTFTGDPSKDLPAIRQRESGGDYNALNYVAKSDPTAWDRGATATGAYQMVQSTWNEGKKLAGIDADKYPRAMDAPPAVQDQVAQAVYAKHGTAPWDASKFGANWVLGSDGRYQLVKGAQPGSGTGAPLQPGTTQVASSTPTPPAVPGSKLPTPPVPPTAGTPGSGFGAGAFGTAPAGSTLAAVPQDQANAPNTTATLPPVPTPQMVAAQATARRTGKPAPIEGTDGLYVDAKGNVGSGPNAGGLGKRAAADAIVSGMQTAQTMMPPGVALTAGPGVPTGDGGGATAPAPATGRYGTSAFGTTVPPPASTTNPPAVVAPQPTTMATPQPPPTRDIKAQNPDGSFTVPDEKLSVPEFQDRHRKIYSPEELQQRGIVLPDNPQALQTAYQGVQQAEQDARAARQAAQTAYSMTGDAGRGAMAAVNEADKNAQDARQKYTDLIQGTNEKNATALAKLYSEQDAQLATDRNNLLDRIQKGALQTQAEKAAVSKSGQEVAFGIDKTRLESMTNQATSAHDTSINLQSIASQLSSLPEGSEASVLSYLSPGQVAWLRNANIISGDKVDAAQVVEGLKNYLAVQMRPVGSGALRGAEMDRFQASLPTMLQSAAGRQKALAFMSSYLDRVQSEAEFASDYYSRPKADGTPEFNLRGLSGAMNAPKSQGGLGEVIPHAPSLNAPAADHQAFLGGIEKGKPYYGWQNNPTTGQPEQVLMVR